MGIWVWNRAEALARTTVRAVTVPQPRLCPLCGNIVCRHMAVNEAGERMSGVVNNVRHANDWDDIKNSWMVFKLEDGSSDGTIYDTKDDAVWYQRNKASKFFYLSLRQCMHGMSPKEATLILAMTRVQSERGRYNPTPEDLRDPINPITSEGVMADIMSTKMGLPWVSPALAGRFVN
jgi:hypothetical protein